MPSILPWKLVYGLLIEVQYHFVFAPSLGVSYFTVILVVEPWLLNQACISRTSKFRQGFCLFRKGWPLPIQNNPKVGEFSVKSISSFYNFTQKLCVWGQDIVLKVCFIEVPLISPSLPKEHECSRLVYLKSFGCLWTLGPYVDPLPNIQKSRGSESATIIVSHRHILGAIWRMPVASADLGLFLGIPCWSKRLKTLLVGDSLVFFIVSVELNFNHWENERFCDVTFPSTNLYHFWLIVVFRRKATCH